MKHALLIFSLALFSTIVAQAQQWSCYTGSDTLYYINWGGEYRGLMATDSTVQPGVVKYKIYRTTTIDPTCNASANGETRNSKTPIWAGVEVHKYDNGDNVFFNNLGESITINTLAEVGDVWPCYTDANAFRIYGTVISKDTATLFGNVIDSVKTIRLLAPNYTTVDVMQWDSVEILLSANFGLINAPIFHFFPKENRLITRTIRKPLTYGDMYSYEVGDYFQIQEIFSFTQTDTKYRFFKVLNKAFSNGGNSVTFTMHREFQWNTNGNNSVVFTDTVDLTYHNLKGFVGSGVPQSMYLGYVSVDIAGDSSPSLFGRRRLELENHREFRVTSDSCMNRYLFDDGFPPPISYECLGELLPWASSISGNISQSVTFYSLCGASGGNKVVLQPTPPIGVDELSQASILTYPNPTADLVMIVNPTNSSLKVTVLDLQGQALQSLQLQPQSQNQMDLSTYPMGVYLLQFHNEGHVFYRKVIVAR